MCDRLFCVIGRIGVLPLCVRCLVYILCLRRPGTLYGVDLTKMSHCPI